MFGRSDLIWLKERGQKFYPANQRGPALLKTLVFVKSGNSTLNTCWQLCIHLIYNVRIFRKTYRKLWEENTQKWANHVHLSNLKQDCFFFFFCNFSVSSEGKRLFKPSWHVSWVWLIIVCTDLTILPSGSCHRKQYPTLWKACNLFVSAALNFSCPFPTLQYINLTSAKHERCNIFLYCIFNTINVVF